MIHTTLLVLYVAALPQVGQDSSKTAPPPKATATRPAGVGGAPSRDDLERAFEAQLGGATLSGVWRMTDQNGTLDAGHAESYTISTVEKVGDDDWLITARIAFEGKDVSLPVAVRVLWAGDTPVITLDNVGMPGLGTYSARVMIHRGLYAGTWFGAGHGGVMSGQITRGGDVRSAREPAPASRPGP